MTSRKKHFPSERVLPIAKDLARMLRPACEWLAIGGSLRRGSGLVADVEIIARPQVIEGDNALHWLTDEMVETEVVQKARVGKKQQTRWGEKHRKLLFCGIQFDLFLCDEHNQGYIYWLRTGSADANKYLVRKIKASAPFRLDQGYVYVGDRRLSIPDEQAWFKLLGLPYVPPHQRIQDVYVELMDGHRWPDPDVLFPPEMVTQTTMFSMAQFLEIQDTHKNLDPGVGAVRQETLWFWESPWLRDDQVWIDVGYGEWQQYPVNSTKAQSTLRYLQTHPLHRENERRRLNTWLMLQEARKRHTQFEDAHELDDIPAWILHNGVKGSTVALRVVPIDLVVPTQRELIYSIVEHYNRTGAIRDRDGHYAFGLRFQGDARIYLTNGHHRLMAARVRGQQHFTMQVDTLPITYERAAGLIDIDDGLPENEWFLVEVLEEALAILGEREATA